MGDLSAKEQIEIEVWKADGYEPGAHSLGNLIRVCNDARPLLSKLAHYKDLFSSAGDILEVGGGEGWGSCIVKSRFPGRRVLVSDISPFALEALPSWENLLKVQVDDSFSCRSYEIPLPDASLDLVWCYIAAHHFVAHRRTLKEIHRVLRPGGTALYLHEPSCPAYIHKAAHRRVNRKRPEVPEDVLRTAEIMRLGKDAGFEVSVRHDPSPVGRQPLETVYYIALSRIGLLRYLLPCSVDFVFHKPA